MHPLRTQRVQRSSVRLFALLGLVLTALLGFGASSYFLNADAHGTGHCNRTCSLISG